jgi:hypothetical protein
LAFIPEFSSMQLRAKSISVFLMCALVMASVGWPVSAVGKRASHSNAVKDLALTASYDTTTGTLRGYVREPESAPGIPGAGIPGVVVRATNTETGNQRSVRTNLEGFYFISLLPVGKYIISAEKDGLVLQGAAKPATINLNKTFVLVPDIILVPPAPPPPLAVNTPPPDASPRARARAQRSARDRRATHQSTGRDTPRECRRKPVAEFALG